MKKGYSLIVLVSIILSGCSLMEDDATHLAYTLKRGARHLKRSSKTEEFVRYEPLKGIKQTYFVEINSTIPSNNPDSIQFGGGIRVGGENIEMSFTGYHQRYVVVPRRLYIDKLDSATMILLKKNGKKIEVVNLY